MSLALECHPNNALDSLLLFIIYIYLNTLIIGKFFDSQDRKYKFLIKEHIGLLIFFAFIIAGLSSKNEPISDTMQLQRDFSFWSIPVFAFLKFIKKRNPEIQAVTKIKLIGWIMTALGIAIILAYPKLKIRLGNEVIWNILEAIILTILGIGILLRNNIFRIIAIIYSIIVLMSTIATIIIITQGRYPASLLVINILFILLIILLTRKDIKEKFYKKTHNK